MPSILHGLEGILKSIGPMLEDHMSIYLVGKGEVGVKD